MAGDSRFRWLSHEWIANHSHDVDGYTRLRMWLLDRSSYEGDLQSSEETTEPSLLEKKDA